MGLDYGDVELSGFPVKNAYKFTGGIFNEYNRTTYFLKSI
ncbi:hypothetical protein SAMN05216225_101177 [Ornithinibacillus halophilus]|uniref:Uncharacterized protein n=1 Tax=Ornithinibacillus halophilus TaxID=930117 RepID=A0A1M5G5A6_9BACI|nr:hypothetical protein SAMN05216225_101177 [Ornithinibacillus halophilus]